MRLYGKIIQISTKPQFKYLSGSLNRAASPKKRKLNAGIEVRGSGERKFNGILDRDRSMNARGKPKGGHSVTKMGRDIQKINHQNEVLQNALMSIKPQINFGELSKDFENNVKASKYQSLFPKIDKTEQARRFYQPMKFFSETSHDVPIKKGKTRNAKVSQSVQQPLASLA